jgi:hypothetical protein
LRKSLNPLWSKPADPLQDLSHVSWTSDTSVSLRMKRRCQVVAHRPAEHPPAPHQHHSPSSQTNCRQSARVTTIRTHYRERVVDIDFIFPHSHSHPNEGEILTEGRVGPLSEIVATSSILLFAGYKRPHPGHRRRTLGRQLASNRYIDSVLLDVMPLARTSWAVAADTVSYTKCVR